MNLNGCRGVTMRSPSGKRRRTPWQRIARAAEMGGGCVLTPEDVAALSCDDALMTRAGFDDEVWDDCPVHDYTSADSCPWCVAGATLHISYDHG